MARRKDCEETPFFFFTKEAFSCTFAKNLFALEDQTPTSVSLTNHTSFQIESPLKQAWPSGCLVGAKYDTNSREFFINDQTATASFCDLNARAKRGTLPRRNLR